VRLLNSMILILTLVTVGDEPQGSDSRAAQLRAMRALVDGVAVTETAEEGRLQSERLAEPVYRFDDAARHVSDGTVWVWGQTGRPSAVLTLTKHNPPARERHWLTELTSLAPRTISATVAGIGTWQPSSAGVVIHKLPKAPLPADDPAKRLRQMKELVQPIKAHETSRPREGPTAKPAKRYELRVLPQPVHRYADATSGLIDGGMFIIAYGLNPELVLLLEARRDGSSAPAWHYGFARISVMDLHVAYESKELWSTEGLDSAGPDDTYWLFTRPIVGE
jgi:hypothetical protein